tara:strand:+ start:117 stop:350 length:234 start_codon:yes stop_codon:yes gene_type:complete
MTSKIDKEEFLNPLTVTKEEEQQIFLEKIKPKSTEEEEIMLKKAFDKSLNEIIIPTNEDEETEMINEAIKNSLKSKA